MNKRRQRTGQDREPTGNPEIYDYDPDYVRPESRGVGQERPPGVLLGVGEVSMICTCNHRTYFKKLSEYLTRVKIGRLCRLRR